MSKFLDLLRSGEEISCDLIIGGSDMPASFVWDENCKITDYGTEKYKSIMEAKYTRLPNGNIEIHCDDDKLGESFCWAAAGYIGLTEFEKIFGKDEEENSALFQEERNKTNAKESEIHVKVSGKKVQREVNEIER